MKIRSAADPRIAPPPQMTAETYTIVVEPDEIGDLVVSVPALHGCFTHGRTVEECKERAVEAIEVHIAGLIADAEPVPAEIGQPQLLSVTVAARLPFRPLGVEIVAAE